MSWAAPLGFLLLAAGVAAGLAQLWFGIFPPETFFKLLVTDGALLALLIGWAFVVKERRESRVLRNRDRLE